MAAELSPRAWHCIAQFMPNDSYYGVDALSSCFHRNSCDEAEDWHIDPAYFDSEGFRVQSGVYSLADSVDTIFAQGPPVMLVDTRWMPPPKTLIHAIVERFKAVASGPHHFRPVHAYYRWQGSRYVSTLEGMYRSIFPCWRCDATFDVPHRNHGPFCCQDDLAIFIFEHDASVCRVPIAGRMPVAGREMLQNADVRQEVFQFLSRFELDTVQHCSHRWCNFVDATANTMALYRIQFTLDMKGGAHVEIWNWSATGILPHHRRFNLCDEPVTTPHNLIRNSVSNVRFHPHGADSWSCLLWVLRGATNTFVGHLEVHAFNEPPEVNAQSLQETVERGGVRSLHLMFAPRHQPLDHMLVVACGRVRGLTASPWRSFRCAFNHECMKNPPQLLAGKRSPPKRQRVDDVTWITELLTTSELRTVSIYLRFWRDQTVFNGSFDLRKLPSAIAQVFVDALSFENLPNAFVVDVSRISSLFEPPAGEPSFKGLLNLSYALRHPRTVEFETTVYHLRNARSGDYVTVLIGRGTRWNSSEQTLRVFKGRQRFTNDSN